MVLNIDWQFVIQSLPLFVKAAYLTLKLSFWGILLSLAVGLLCSVVMYYRVKVLTALVKVYIELSRNTPLLIQLFFLYYGLPKMGIKLEAETCAIIGLTFLGGSYMAEAFRAGLESIGKAQVEAGLSLALTKAQLIRYILLPQAFSVALPSLSANIIFLIKETSIVSAIALADLLYVAKDLIGIYYATFESMAMLVAAYLIILLPLSLLLSLAERKVRYAEFGN